MRYAVLSILALLGLAGCSSVTGGPSGSWREEIADAMAAVAVEDGINQAEANTIASVYFISRISGCGTTGEPESEGEHWVAPVYFGYAGLPIEPIFIDRQTGAIAWRNSTMSLARLKIEVALW